MANILAIDDSPSVVTYLAEVLGEAGHQIAGLKTFALLPQALSQNPPDLIILDLSMPALSGERFGYFIRRFAKGFIPILIYSSRPAEELEEAVRTIGAECSLSKDQADANELRRTVARILHNAPTKELGTNE